METANDRLIADIVETTRNAVLEAAAAQLHITTWWLTTTTTVIIDRARYSEAYAAVQQ